MKRRAFPLAAAFALLAPAAAAQDALPPDMLARLCDGRAGCKLGWLRPAGADQYGRSLAIAEIDLGERRGPKDHILCEPYRREYWLVISGAGNAAPRKLFEACPQPQIGAPEPELKIGANFMEYAATNGVDPRTRISVSLQLSPLKRVSETGCDAAVAAGRFEAYRWDWQRLRGEWRVADKGVAEADLCRPEKAELRGWIVPLVTAVENLPPDAAPHLGSCAAAFDETGSLGFVLRGAPAAAGTGGSFRVAVVGQNGTHVLVTVLGATGADDRIELRVHHRSRSKSAAAFEFRIADGAPLTGADSPERPAPVARAHDPAGQRTSLRWRLADGTTPNRLTVTLIRREGGKEIRATATALGRGDDPATLGDVTSVTAQDGRCAAADGTLDIVEMGLLPE